MGTNMIRISEGQRIPFVILMDIANILEFELSRVFPMLEELSEKLDLSIEERIYVYAPENPRVKAVLERPAVVNLLAKYDYRGEPVPAEKDVDVRLVMRAAFFRKNGRGILLSFGSGDFTLLQAIAYLFSDYPERLVVSFAEHPSPSTKEFLLKNGFEAWVLNAPRHEEMAEIRSRQIWCQALKMSFEELEEAERMPVSPEEIRIVSSILKENGPMVVGKLINEMKERGIRRSKSVLAKLFLTRKLKVDEKSNIVDFM